MKNKKQKIELLAQLAGEKKQFRQIHVLMCSVLKNSPYAFTVLELHEELQKYGYHRNLDTTYHELNRLIQHQHVFVCKKGKTKYYFML